MTKAQLLEHVSALDPKQHYAAPIWATEDVLDKAKRMHERITKTMANDIIDLIDRKHDCEVGITWDTIECYIEDAINDRQKIENERKGR